eukprot:16119284-Heterocapsa_arctica.AAC.1
MVVIPRPGTILAWMVVAAGAAPAVPEMPSPRCLRRSGWSLSRSARCQVTSATLLARSEDSKSEK